MEGEPLTLLLTLSQAHCDLAASTFGFSGNGTVFPQIPINYLFFLIKLTLKVSSQKHSQVKQVIGGFDRRQSGWHVNSQVCGVWCGHCVEGQVF